MDQWSCRLVLLIIVIQPFSASLLKRGRDTVTTQSREDFWIASIIVQKRTLYAAEVSADQTSIHRQFHDVIRMLEGDYALQLRIAYCEP